MTQPTNADIDGILPKGPYPPCLRMLSCQKGPTRHAYAWQIGPFWQDALYLTHVVQSNYHNLARGGFADQVFRFILLKARSSILIKIPPKYVLLTAFYIYQLEAYFIYIIHINFKSKYHWNMFLVPYDNWFRCQAITSTSFDLIDPIQLTHICITRPHRLNCIHKQVIKQL